jgi:hypothetical protein
MLGMPIEDGTRLVPIDAPTIAPFTPDWESGLNEAMTLFPSLILARQDLKKQQLNLITQKNLLLPFVNFTATYDYNAIGSQLDGSIPANAWKNLGKGNFNDWSVGIRGEIPIGYRDAHAAVRQARLQLSQSYLQLRDQELKVQRFLAQQYRNVFEFYQRIQAGRAEREAYAQLLNARFKQFLAGRGTLDFLLQAQQSWADALSREYQNIANYNKSLAAFEFAKGTLLQYDNVIIAEGGLPKCAQVRAVEHERERSKALVVMEHARPVEQPMGRPAGECDIPEVPTDMAALPKLPRDRAPSLPALMKNQPLVPEIDDSMSPESKTWIERVVHEDTKDVPAPSKEPPADTGTEPAALPDWRKSPYKPH